MAGSGRSIRGIHPTTSERGERGQLSCAPRPPEACDRRALAAAAARLPVAAAAQGRPQPGGEQQHVRAAVTAPEAPAERPESPQTNRSARLSTGTRGRCSRVSRLGGRAKLIWSMRKVRGRPTPRWRDAPASAEQGRTWRSRPCSPGVIKALVVLIPAAAAIATTSLLNWGVEPPRSLVLRVGWWVILLVGEHGGRDRRRAAEPPAAAARRAVQAHPAVPGRGSVALPRGPGCRQPAAPP